MPPYTQIPIEERFWSKVNFDAPNGCWEWTGARQTGGYGQTNSKRNGRYETHRAHRVSFALWYGYWPPEQTDHLCKNRPCVNPFHLEAVTPRINILRGESGSAQNARKTHCKNGHPLSGDNLRLKRRANCPDRIERRCRECHNESQRRLYVARRS